MPIAHVKTASGYRRVHVPERENQVSNQSLEDLRRIVDGLPEVERRVMDDLTLPTENKARLAAQARQKHLDLLRDGAASLMQRAAERVESSAGALERTKQKYADSRNWAKASVLSSEVAAWASTARSWDDLAKRVEAAKGDREHLEALQNIALPTLVKRSMDESSPLHGVQNASAQVSIESTVQDHLWELTPSHIKTALGEAVKAARDFEAIRNELMTLSMHAGGIAEYRQNFGPLGDILRPGQQGGIFDAAPQAVAESTAPGIFG